jgi:multiple sugar transport system ATP-binding protein
MASVAFEHVDKVYPGGTQAIADCTLAIADGELVVFVGPSGCGKSTLLRMLAGLETVTRGAIRIGEWVVNDLTPQERNVAMVFQDYALYPFMTVRRNLEFPLRMRRMARTEIDRQVAWAADILEIGGVLERLPKQLSGGQRQRVAMGRALVRQPTVSLLDEPLSNLDAKLRVDVRAEIAELQRRVGTTMVYVTHDQTEAMTLGHRIAVLDHGRIQQIAPPQELYDRPANAFVAGFIGNPPMNILPARARAADRDRIELTVGGQRVAVHTPLAAAIGSADRAMRIGIRPEGLTIAPAPAAGRALDAEVDHVEFLGHETLLHAHLATGEDPPRLVVRIAGMEHRAAGDRVQLVLDGAQLHVFDEHGCRIG